MEKFGKYIEDGSQCETCAKRAPVSATMPYTCWLLELLTMQDAGGQFDLDLLDSNQWLDLGLMRRLRAMPAKD